MNFPPFPSQSLYGSFPNFPVNYVTVPNLLHWAQVGLYYGNILNYPYNNPPPGTVWKIPYPVLTGIPGWIAEIFDYALGWVAAFLLWLVQVFVIVISDPIDYLVNLGSNAINWTIQEIESISSHAGIFAPVVAALLMGMLLVVLVVGIFAAINLLKGLGEGAE